MPSINDRYTEHDQYMEDRRPSEPCPICKGTGEIRFDFINKDERIINGYKFLRGTNATYKPCECMKTCDCEGACECEARHYVEPVQVTVEYGAPLPSVIYGECRRCHAETEIDCNGYCFNC
jgi:hypothetical protein